MKTIKRTLLVVAAGAFVWLAWKAPAQDAPPYAAQSQISYGAQQVLKLEQAKVGDTTIITYIANSQTSYGLDAAQIIYLRQQGVSDAVLTAMLTQSRAGAAAADASQASAPPAMAATPVADTADVATASAPPAVTYVQTAPTVDDSYCYPNYAYYGWPWSWVWWGGAWHWGGNWNGGWHAGGGSAGWHGGGWGGGWHGGSWGGGWHGGGGSWHSGGGGFHFGGGHSGGGGFHFGGGSGGHSGGGWHR
jgi:hypothetical protein